MEGDLNFNEVSGTDYDCLLEDERCSRDAMVAGERRTWRSNTSEKCSKERLPRGKVTSISRGAAHLSEGAGCGAGADCSARKYINIWQGNTSEGGMGEVDG